MDDLTPSGRRRFLESVGVGGAALLAGCTDQLDVGDGGGDADEQVTADSGDNTASVAAIVAVDQTALQEEQAEIQSEFQNGNLTQEEAREELSTLQDEYLGEAITNLTGTVEETEGVSVDDTYRSLGAVTVSGNAAAVLAILDADSVSALVSKADLDAQVQTTQESSN
ncbi:hypothetical protein [Halobellus rufus]|uniref:hypothetical protein n=1 Tax=Halobellus rufus TaxID=1448860 RepID=UPI0006791F4A|nr:hypothetical protein [Halobellus rufus]